MLLAPYSYSIIDYPLGFIRVFRIPIMYIRYDIY